MTTEIGEETGPVALMWCGVHFLFLLMIGRWRPSWRTAFGVPPDNLWLAGTRSSPRTSASECKVELGKEIDFPERWRARPSPSRYDGARASVSDGSLL